MKAERLTRSSVSCEATDRPTPVMVAGLPRAGRYPGYDGPLLRFAYEEPCHRDLTYMSAFHVAAAPEQYVKHVAWTSWKW